MFVESCQSIDARYVSLIIPSRWMIGGIGLSQFRFNMLKLQNIRYIHDFLDSSQCFPNNDIKGGICFFLLDKEYSGKVDYFLHTANNEIKHSKRFLSTEDEDIVFRFQEYIDIFSKVKGKYISFSNIVSSVKYYGLDSDFLLNPVRYNKPNKLKDSYFEGSIAIYGLLGKDRVVKYVDKNYPIELKRGFDKYKIFITEAYGCGIIGEIPSTPILSTPNSISTATFLQIGPFDTEKERNNCYSYIKTKFFRFMVGIRKGTQHCTQDCYKYVPLVSFEESWDDEKLYKLFELSDDDIKFIEDNIQEVDWDENC